ncbi:MAG: hypothetical protein EO766_11885 [Hydrotalea sp. AMD]|uniref:hypothetical protein n=1 Tax=Hydrotalea sp. AMD TaxID=2501297 RepID=UPI0010264AA3|nr:hypothetical protein [Hydrotalea sp. AMD]RWZ87221.1 MAG: hypothetical protein EO766_11885 [Hydrotalea sp. AMD]
MANPITPQEVVKRRLNSIPGIVIDIINDLIVKNWKHSSNWAIVKQDDIVTAIATTMNVSNQEIFNKGWLEIEDLYREVGWQVLYDKPDSDEIGAAYFRFKSNNR